MEINYAEERCFKVRVTPELAQEWLNRNKCNRTISTKYVKTIVKDMRNGKWVTNNATIALSKEGELLDGQHRLTALVETGIPQMCYVMTGLEKSSHFDDGRKRSIRDQLLATGKVDRGDPLSSSYCIAVARFLYNRANTGNGRTQNERPSTDETFYFMVEHEDAFRFIYEIAKNKGGGVNCRASHILAAVFVAHEAGVAEIDLVEWFRVVRTGEYSGDNQLSGLSFRNLLISSAYVNRTSSLVVEETFLKAQYSISNFNRRKVKLLKAKECYPLPKWIEDHA